MSEKVKAIVASAVLIVLLAGGLYGMTNQTSGPSLVNGEEDPSEEADPVYETFASNMTDRNWTVDNEEWLTLDGISASINCTNATLELRLDIFVAVIYFTTVCYTRLIVDDCIVTNESAYGYNTNCHVNIVEFVNVSAGVHVVEVQSKYDSLESPSWAYLGAIHMHQITFFPATTRLAIMTR